MIYRGPDRCMIWLLSRQETRPATHRKTEKERQLADGRGVGGGGGAKSYEGEKTWPSINHSILSGEEIRLAAR
jgi:hypothetical protein